MRDRIIGTIVIFLGCSDASPEEGGRWAGVSDAPYTIWLRGRDTQGRLLQCTGSKVAPRLLLTARHCLEGLASGQITVGRGEEAGRETTFRSFAPPDEAPASVYDVSFAWTESDFPDTPSLPIRLKLDPLPDRVAFYGYGCGEERRLREVSMGVAPEDRFARLGLNEAGRPVNQREAPVLLLTGQRACKGDSGAPVVRGGEIVGVVRGTVTGALPDLEQDVLAFKFDEASRSQWVSGLRGRPEFAGVRWIE